MFIPTEHKNYYNMVNSAMDKATTICNTLNLNINKFKTIHINFTLNKKKNGIISKS